MARLRRGKRASARIRERNCACEQTRVVNVARALGAERTLRARYDPDDRAARGAARGPVLRRLSVRARSQSLCRRAGARGTTGASRPLRGAAVRLAASLPRGLGRRATPTLRSVRAGRIGGFEKKVKVGFVGQFELRGGVSTKYKTHRLAQRVRALRTSLGAGRKVVIRHGQAQPLRAPGLHEAAGLRRGGRAGRPLLGATRPRRHPGGRRAPASRAQLRVRADAHGQRRARARRGAHAVGPVHPRRVQGRRGARLEALRDAFARPLEPMPTVGVCHLVQRA